MCFILSEDEASHTLFTFAGESKRAFTVATATPFQTGTYGGTVAGGFEK